MMASTIFHQGDLQSGIALAIQQRKLVACFVRGDDATSKQWEEEWLASPVGTQSETLGERMTAKAVVLRIDFASQEAGFLGAFCPLEGAPVMVVIRDGKVLEKLEGTVDEAAFRSRLVTVCDLGEPEGTADRETTGDTTSREGVGLTAPRPSSTPQNDAMDPNVQAMLNERAQRLEADRLRREAAAKADRQARADERRRESAAASNNDKGKQPASSEPTPQSKAREQWIHQQAQRKQEAKKERERILNQIEADKQERKIRAESAKEKEKMTGQYSEANPDSPPTTTTTTTFTSKPPKGAASQTCALQIRLFDGSSLRSTFPSTSTLTSAVRPWIAAAAPANFSPDSVPYTFRHIQPPQPSRSIEVSEEHQSLQELGLTPNATLVLAPVGGAVVDAYNGSSGVLQTALAAPFWFASSAYGVVTAAAEYLPSLLSAPTPAEAPSSESGVGRQGDGPARGEGYKSFADQKSERGKEKGAEFYNGNSSAFEGRRDDEDEGAK